MGEPRVDQLLDAGAGLAGQVSSQGILTCTARRGEADPEGSRKRFADAPVHQQRAPGLACRRRPQHVLVIRLRLGIELDRAPTLSPRASWGVRPTLELHPRPIREQLERLAEIDAFDLLDELEEVTAFVAAMAVPDLAFGTHGEGRRLFGVERAQPGELATGSMEADVPADHLDQIEARLDLRDGITCHGPPALTAA